MREQLRLVTSFSELMAGMIVVVKPCSWCGGSHRSMLTRFEPLVVTVTGDGMRTAGPAWLREPSPSCECPKRMWATVATVECGIVYRVEDGLEASSSERTTKKKRERA